MSALALLLKMVVVFLVFAVLGPLVLIAAAFLPLVDLEAVREAA